MNHPDDPQLPADLIADLRRHDRRPLPDTSQIDQQVRHAAAQHFGQADPVVATLAADAGRWRFRRRLLGSGLAAAAVIGLMVWLNQEPTNPFAPSSPPSVARESPSQPNASAPPLVIHQSAKPELLHDFNHDGTLDVLDVMRLAQHVHNPPASQTASASLSTYDVNGDSLIDARDIQTLGHAIVRIAPRKEGDV